MRINYRYTKKDNQLANKFTKTSQQDYYLYLILIFVVSAAGFLAGSILDGGVHWIIAFVFAFAILILLVISWHKQGIYVFKPYDVIAELNDNDFTEYVQDSRKQKCWSYFTGYQETEDYFQLHHKKFVTLIPKRELDLNQQKEFKDFVSSALTNSDPNSMSDLYTAYFQNETGGPHPDAFLERWSDEDIEQLSTLALLKYEVDKPTPPVIENKTSGFWMSLRWIAILALLITYLAWTTSILFIAVIAASVACVAAVWLQLRRNNRIQMELFGEHLRDKEICLKLNSDCICYGTPRGMDCYGLEDVQGLLVGASYVGVHVLNNLLLAIPIRLFGSKPAALDFLNRVNAACHYRFHPDASQRVETGNPYQSPGV